MKVGVIGLGRMGEAIAYRLHKAGIDTIGFDINNHARDAAQVDGIATTDSLEQLVKNCDVLWMLIPSGNLVDTVIEQMKPYLVSGKIIIDGGNSKYSDSIIRAKNLLQLGVHFIDCGTSGGVYGKENGFCLMVGGDKNIYQKLIPALKAVATQNGFEYVGPSGAGHFVKMVHNGIEYGIMQSYAEGFHLLKEGFDTNLHLDLEQIARVWNNGSVIRSWLLELVEEILKDDQELKNISGEVADTGMGKWTVEHAQKVNVPVDEIKTALLIRARSRENGGNYATKLVALMRNKFGGHSVKKK